MNIITPPEPATVVQATVAGDYVTLSHQGASLTLPTLARPGNSSEVIYIAESALRYLPGTPPVIAAVLASHAGALTLTLFALPEPSPTNSINTYA
jgi:hypothetical protein